MSKKQNRPAFTLLGYHINKIQYKRIGDEEVEKIMFSVLSKKYDKKTKIYSLVVELAIDFDENKENKIEVLGGFEIFDESIIEEKTLISVFSATLFPFIRTLIYNISFDDRMPVKLPTLDLRHIDVGLGVIVSRNKINEPAL